MKHKTWFRLVLQAIGVLLIGLSLPELFTRLLQAAYYMTDVTMRSRADMAWWFLAAPGVQFLFGIYLLCGGTWIVNRVIPSNRPYCPECGYDLTRTRSERCPECGVVLSREPPTTPP